MNISVTDAKSQLTELVRRAEQGEEVVLTRRGQPVARIAPLAKARLTPEERGRVIDEFIRATRGKVRPGPDAAHAADFLYGENGEPV